MAFCDYLITVDIQGYDCQYPLHKGAERRGVIINRSFVDYGNSVWEGNFVLSDIKLYCDKAGNFVTQSGKQPFNGTQQEMQEGANVNTITNTLQLIVLKQDKNWAQQLFALMNGEFVVVLQDKNGVCQVYGWETGLHCTGAVRELYNDDNLSGWQITFTEEGASKGNIFTTLAVMNNLPYVVPCDD